MLLVPQRDSVVDLEASHKMGCRLCSLFIQNLPGGEESLGLLHRITRRLKCLGQACSIQIVANRFQNVVLRTSVWMEYPGLSLDYRKQPQGHFMRRRTTPELSIIPFTEESRKFYSKLWIDFRY